MFWSLMSQKLINTDSVTIGKVDTPLGEIDDYYKTFIFHQISTNSCIAYYNEIIISWCMLKESTNNSQNIVVIFP